MCILEILNNTFIGTFFAGLLLALLGIFLYRKQKAIDIKYSDHNKIRELVALLYTHIEIASKNFQSQLNIYDGSYPQFKIISDALNQKFENRLSNDIENESHSLALKINSMANDLMARLKLMTQDYSNEIEIIASKIPMLGIYLSGSFILKTLNATEILSFKNGFDETVGAIKKVLQNLLEFKIRPDRLPSNRALENRSKKP